MQLSTILNFSRIQAQTDSNGLTDANGIVLPNEALQDFHRKLVDAGVDASQIQETYTNMTANVGTYLYPSDMLFLKAIELDYSGTGGNNYKVANQVDVSNLPSGSFSALRLNANSNYPQFDDHGDWFEIFPTPQANASQGIRMFYFLRPTEYSSVSDTVAYPESLDTTILGWRIAANYLYSITNITKGDAFMAKYNERVKDYIATLSRGSQQPIQATPLQINGFEY